MPKKVTKRKSKTYVSKKGERLQLHTNEAKKVLAMAKKLKPGRKAYKKEGLENYDGRNWQAFRRDMTGTDIRVLYQPPGWKKDKRKNHHHYVVITPRKKNKKGKIELGETEIYKNF
ncbi:hypothetical protein KAH94_03745 [bacterium]|nr:hypothetical protein [bacterium]